MNNAFFELLDDTVTLYLDDVLIYSKDVKSHHKALHAIFKRLA